MENKLLGALAPVPGWDSSFLSDPDKLVFNDGC